MISECINISYPMWAPVVIGSVLTASSLITLYLRLTRRCRTYGAPFVDVVLLLIFIFGFAMFM